MKLILSIILAVFIMGNTATSEPISQEAIFISGEDGYHTYRIPSIITTQDGTLLAFCEGRKAGMHDAGNIDLLLKRSTDNGKTWSDTIIVWDDGDNTCGNPCPVVDQTTGTIWLLLTHNLGHDSEAEIVAGTSEGSRTVWVSHSTDDGKTWAEPTEITKSTKKENWSWYATGPGVGIQLQHEPYKNRMVIPCDHKTLGDAIGYHSHVIYSDDHGKTWQLGGIAPDGTNECQIIERTDGSLLLNMRRSRHNPAIHRAIATSQDGGATWSDLSYDSTLIAPRCQASIIRDNNPTVADQPMVLFSNPASKDQRIKMTVRLSEDDGVTWSHSKLIHDGPSAYSCLTILQNGEIACFYEGGEQSPYENIYFTKFTLDWLKSQEEN